MSASAARTNACEGSEMTGLQGKTAGEIVAYVPAHSFDDRLHLNPRYGGGCADLL
jgi:hypothetical protein